MHLHDYLCSKYQLKSSYTCASQYQIPSLIEWFFLELLGRRQWNIISEIGKLDWNDFFEYIKLIPNLEYIVIYKKILPYSIKQALMHNKYVEIYFNNESDGLIKILNDLNISATIVPTDQVFNVLRDLRYILLFYDETDQKAIELSRYAVRKSKNLILITILDIFIAIISFISKVFE